MSIKPTRVVFVALLASLSLAWEVQVRNNVFHAIKLARGVPHAQVCIDEWSRECVLCDPTGRRLFWNDSRIIGEFSSHYVTSYVIPTL